MATKKTKGSKKSSKSARASSPETAEPTGKAQKTIRIQGVQVLTPGGKKKVGRRGALGHVKLSSIKIKEGFNPRSDIGDVSDLESSIKKVGLLEPLVVRPTGDGKTFWLVSGERRHRALKNIGSPITDSVPVTIRPDLEGEESGSLAVALAENSEDGRNNLSVLDIGNTCQRMLKDGWTVSSIHSHTGLHSKKIRRCIEVIEAGDDIVAKVADGTLGMVAALEVKKLPKSEREAILKRTGPGATADDIRRIRKRIEGEERSAAIAKGEDKSKTKAGKPRDRKLSVRRSSRELTEQVRLMAHTIENMEGKERDTDSFYELRGGLAALLWVQGEIDDPVLPSLEVDSESSPKRAKKTNAAFDMIVKHEASLYEPEGDDADSEGDDEAKDEKSK